MANLQGGTSDYFTFVTTPMDLGTISSKLTQKESAQPSAQFEVQLSAQPTLVET